MRAMTYLPFILFLDFDGVLHPRCTGTMRYAPQLEALLADFPNVRVVVTSTWRLSHDLEDLRGWFSRAFAPRVIDVTPYLGEGAGVRQREIEQWLQAHAVRGWLAVDDEAQLFSPACPNLYITSSKEGLDQNALLGLRNHLVSIGA